MRLKIDTKSLLAGIAIGAGTLLLLGADGNVQAVGPGQSFPRFQLSNQWYGGTSGDHGVYKIDTYNGDVTEIVGNRATPVQPR